MAIVEEAVAEGALSISRRRVLMVCAWCGPATVGVAFVGWIAAGVLPFPLGPADSAERVVAFYAGGLHVTLGLVIASIGVSLVTPLLAAVSRLMVTATPASRVLSTVQLIAASVTAVMLLVPMLIMAVAAFRPERSPDVTVMLNDLAWLLFITPVAPFIIQNLVIATSALRDPLSPFPRWVGYLNCWVAFTFSFDVLALVFRGGPFGWNSILIFWLALSTYSLFLFVMFLTVRSAARALPPTDADGSSR